MGIGRPPSPARRSPARLSPARRAAVAALAAAVSLTVGGSAAATETTPAPAPVPTAIPALSGLPWASGAYIPGKDPAVHDAFGDYRGSGTDVVVTWPARRTWDDLTNAAWLYAAWRDQPRTTVYGFPPIPEDGVSSLAACAAGAYAPQWTAVGRQIQGSGTADRTVLRLGWEFTGNWYAWSARDPGQFAECWRQVHAAVEAEAPGVRWDWNVNRGRSPLGIDPRDAYPGDAYVDYVGVDSYDWYPGVRTEEDWQEHYAGPFGLRSWADFAASRGKKLSVPEWGVHPGTQAPAASGGDNPFYIEKMVSFFAEQEHNLAYEAYFNGNAAYYAGSLFAPVQVPKASAAYADAYRAVRAGVRPGPTTVYRTDVTYGADGVFLGTPRATPTATGVTLTAEVAVNRPVTFARLARIAIRDSAGKGSDAKGSLDIAYGPSTIRHGLVLQGSRSLAPGTYTAFPSYSLDGVRWVSGPRTTFTVG